MCGITGWIQSDRDLTHQESILKKMSEKLANRGPDAAGIWLSQNAALAHRRLIVIDPEGGGQPMIRQYGNCKFILVYNGELYNTSELRDELKARGHTFQGHSDTEVVLISFIEWGEKCVEKFNGIFAFAIWDDFKQSLFMARDRIGVKPLFYIKFKDTFLFASELKALLAHPEVEPKVDVEGLAEIFALGPARTPGHGVFKGIRELKPGYYLKYDLKNLQIRQYWKLVSAPHPDDLETTTAKVRELLQDAVQRQLVSDVPVCTLLSGGLDSSALSAFAAHYYKKTNQGQLHTYSIDYEGNDKHFKANDFQPDADAPWARLMSEFLRTHQHNITIKTLDLVKHLQTAMLARDLPGMADIDSSLYLFSHEIKKNATVALSGECADEVFGGYPWFTRKESLEASTFPWSLKVKERINTLSPDLIDMVKPEEYISRRYHEALAEVPRLPGESSQEARIREIFYLSLTRWMPTLLDRKDRMSMSTGLEIRVPFCDHRLVEYVWNIPWEMKNYNNMSKGILRKALTGILPEEVLRRRKSPYPKTHNPAYTTAVRTILLEILNDPGSPLLSLINVEWIRSLTKSDTDFDIPWFGQLMRLPQLFSYLIQVDAWLREYKVKIC